MGEAHGSEAETATSQRPNGKLGATLCRGRSPPADTQCGWARSAGGVGSHHQVLRTTLVSTSEPTLAQVEFGDVTRTGLGSTNLVQ